MKFSTSSCSMLMLLLQSATSFTLYPANIRYHPLASRSDSWTQFGGPLISPTTRHATTFLKATSETAISENSETKIVQGLIKNLFSVCAHIQNPELYAPKWADNAKTEIKDGTVGLVASKNIEQGEILSLYPMHALGLRTPKHKSKKPAKKQSKKQKAKKTIHRDFVVFDQDRDGQYFQGILAHSLKQSKPIHSHFKINLPFELFNDGDLQKRDIFVDVNPTRDDGAIPGWLGHFAKIDDGSVSPNCIIVPLPGASPLCALMATENLHEGTELIAFPPIATITDETILKSFQSQLVRRYRSNIEELRAYLAMAYQGALEPVGFDAGSAFMEEQSEDSQNANHEKASFEHPFHQMNMDYPGVRYLHRDPDILAIDNFLTDEECDTIVENAGSHLIPCVIKHPKTGGVVQDPSRTSTNANMPQSDVPSIIEKLVNLLNCKNANYLETLQILKYERGQTFQPHTDGFRGPTSACGFENSGRLVTVFCYLNDVSEGGGTRFTKLNNLTIAPRKGMVVLHFPTTNGFEEDPRTEHEGTVAIDDKWLLVTWMWKHPITDPDYDESLFPSIMGTMKEESSR